VKELVNKHQDLLKKQSAEMSRLGRQLFGEEDRTYMSDIGLTVD